MIVDSSVLIALLKAEPGWEEFSNALKGSGRRWISAANLLEAAIVADGAVPPLGGRFDRLIARVGIEVAPVDEKQVQLARQAYRQFGRGSGSAARLNFGDCFAYALATTRDEPLLFKGDDFVHTDVRSALD